MEKSKLGDKLQLKNQEVEIVACDDCDHLMVNIDADQIALGDLVTLKKAGVRISNPETTEEICLFCEVPKKKTFRDKVNEWFENDDDDDSDFFRSPTISSPSVFGGSPSIGGFGGFGGGLFSGGGASRGW